MVGIVDALGRDATRFRPGDRAADLTTIGAYERGLLRRGDARLVLLDRRHEVVDIRTGLLKRANVKPARVRQVAHDGLYDPVVDIDLLADPADLRAGDGAVATGAYVLLHLRNLAQTALVQRGQTSRARLVRQDRQEIDATFAGSLVGLRAAQG